MVAGCGYNSARSQGDLRSRLGCADCAVSETVRPADPFSTRSTPEVGSAWTIADLQQSVMEAETAGGWLQLGFYRHRRQRQPAVRQPGTLQRLRLVAGNPH